MEGPWDGFRDPTAHNFEVLLRGRDKPLLWRGIEIVGQGRRFI